MKMISNAILIFFGLTLLVACEKRTLSSPVDSSGFPMVPVWSSDRNILMQQQADFDDQIGPPPAEPLDSRASNSRYELVDTLCGAQYGGGFDSAGRLVSANLSCFGRSTDTYQYDTTFNNGVGVTIGTAKGFTLTASNRYLSVGRTFSGTKWEPTVRNWKGSDNTYDTSFGTAGIGQVSSGSESGFGRQVWEDSNGKILVAGYRYAQGRANVLLLRLLTSGLLDTGFATTGMALYSFGPVANDHAYALLPLGSGYLLGGMSRNGVDKSSGLLMRVTSDGRLDTSWNTTGFQLRTFSVAGDTKVGEIRQDSSGRIYVSSLTRVSGLETAHVLSRLHTDGSFDTSFATRGWLTNTYGTLADSWPAIALHTDGSISMAQRETVFRYQTNGTFHSSFGSDGIVIYPYRLQNLLVDSHDNYVGGIPSSNIGYSGQAAVMMVNTAGSHSGQISDYGYISGTAGSRTMEFTLENVGSSMVSLTPIALSAPMSYNGAYPGSGGTCGATLDSGATCTLGLSFGSVGFGPQNGRFNLQYALGTSGTLQTFGWITKGKVSTLLHNAADPTNLGSFLCASGSVSAAQTVTLTNTGLDITDLADWSGGNSGTVKWVGGSFPGTDGTCTTTLLNNETCTVTIDYSAATSADAERDTFILASASRGEGVQWVSYGTTTNPDADADTVNRCVGGVISDCDDSNAAIKPGALENCTNGIDDNCDTVIDLADAASCTDADGDGSYTNVDCSDADNTMYPGNTENVCDGKDNDCDGQTDEGRTDTDGDGYYAECTDCNDAAIGVNPGATENVCNAIDDDCDTLIDEGRTDGDGDNYYAECGDCNDASTAINPGATEDPCNAVDDDCDGQTDETRTDVDGDGYYPECTDCNDADVNINPGVGETCSDGIDNNCNGNGDEC